MTIKAYVLDALGKLWGKIKADYIDTLTARVAALEDMDAIKSTTMTFLGNTVTVYKVGKVVLFQYFGSSGVNIPATAETAGGTLPSGYRPVVRCAFELLTSSTQKIQITFNTSGAVNIYNFGSSAISANSGWIRSFYMFIAS